MPVKQKNDVSSDECREVDEALDFIVIGGLVVPSYIRDLASWLKGPDSSVSPDEMVALLGDRSVGAIDAAAERLLGYWKVRRHVYSRLDENGIDRRCSGAALRSALRVILECRMPAGA